ncbi:hypothetical protein FG386_001975 [Cryptosporidium ryanae]|uniref:uncharacterized protein n=1 Tax=Cryptosporidium ryanae TaxID=515981 RepID=UPI00351A095A|nr:hypothetical protein FG386_001975 [Cryptosporidium ryanae]
MDPLLLDVELTLKGLSQRQTYSSAYQSFSIIKDSITSVNGQLSAPNFINLTFEAINGCLPKEGAVNAKTDFNCENALIGLLVLQRTLLEALDMNILGANYVAISQIIIKGLVDVLAGVVRNKNKLNVDIRYVVSPIRQFLGIIEETRLNPDIFVVLLELLTGSDLSNRERSQIQGCMVELLNVSSENSLIMLAIHKYIICKVSSCGKRQLDVSQDLSAAFYRKIVPPLNSLYFSLLSRFDESQIKEYLDLLILFGTSKQQRCMSEIAFDALSDHVVLLNADLERDLKWIPLYILESLINSIHEIRDVRLIDKYLRTCGTCLYTLMSIKKRNILNHSFNLDIKGLIENYIHSLNQFILTTDSNVHSVVLSSLCEVVYSVQKEMRTGDENNETCQVFELYESFVSAMLPFCSCILEDYRYKLSFSNTISLVTLLIESWDELLVAACYSLDNTLQVYREKRAQGISLFEDCIRTCLNLAAVALCGGLSEGNINFCDVSNMKSELRRIVGSITRAFGPKTLLSFRPLMFEGLKLTDSEFPIKSNSWLLPLLRVHITRTELSFFAEHFLPIAVLLSKFRADFQETEPNHAKLYQILEEQVWSLLPGFFDETLDFADSFGSESGVLRTYLLQLLDRDTTRDHICNALLRISRQTFIGRGLSRKTGTDESNEANKMCNIDNRDYYIAKRTWKRNEEALNKHSQSFLSLMIVKFLNCYSEDSLADASSSFTSKERETQHYLNCIQSLVPFCNEAVLQSNLNNFHKVWDNMAKGIENSNVPCSKIIALLDVAIAMVKRLPLEQVNNILQSFIHILRVILTSRVKNNGSEGNQLQKKIYKGLKSCMDVLATRTGLFLSIKDKIAEIWGVLALDSGKCPSNSLKHRLSCLRVFVQLLSKIDDEEFVLRFGKEQMINPMIPEILFCLREPNISVRTNAIALLKSLIECYIDCQSTFETIIVKMITISRIGCGQINKNYVEVSCVVALTMIFLDYGDIIKRSNCVSENSLLRVILNFAINALNSQDPVMYVNSLKFVKVSLFKLDQTLLDEYVPVILNNALNNEKCSLKCRIQLRKVLISIIRKFGAVGAMHAFPTQHVPLYRYLVRKINKSESRKKRAKETENNYDDILECNEEELITDDLDPRREGGSLGVLDLLDDDDCDNSSDECLKGRSFPKSSGRNNTGGDCMSKERFLTITGDSNGACSDPVDLLSSKASSIVVPAGAGGRTTLRRRTALEEDDLVTFDEKLNMLVVKDNKSAQSENTDALCVDYDQIGLEGLKGAESFVGKPKVGISPNTTSRPNKLKKTRKHHIIVKGASEFKSKRSKGDIVKDGLQPFAYMRLNPALAKEKHKVNATRSISKIFAGKKKGR